MLKGLIGRIHNIVRERVAPQARRTAAVNNIVRPAVQPQRQPLAAGPRPYRPPTIPPQGRAATVVRPQPRPMAAPRAQQPAAPIPARMVRYGDAQQYRPNQPTPPQPVNVSVNGPMPAAPPINLGKLILPGLGLFAAFKFL